MKKFNSFLSPLIKEYVDYQKASEHWNEASYEPNLLLFDRYCQKQYPDTTALSQEIVDSWCRKRKTENNNSCRSRIYVVVSFIRYLRKRGKTEIREPEIPRKERRSYIPHAFTETELNFFFMPVTTYLMNPSQGYRGIKESQSPYFSVFFTVVGSGQMKPVCCVWKTQT
jgi:hypothetical protein